MSTTNPTLRIIPHPVKSQRVYRTKKDKFVDGRLVRPRGTIMYRYLVMGTPDELRSFRLVRGQYYIEAKDGDFAGTPIWSDQRRFNRPMDLVITADGANVIVAEDDFKLAIIDKMKQAKDFGSVMEAAIAQRLADVYVSDLMAPIGPSTEAPKVAKNTSNDQDLDENDIPEEDDDDVLAENDPLNIG